MSSLLLSTYLLPWIEKHYTKLYAYFNDTIEDSLILNGRNNFHDTQMHLTHALRSLALAKLNGEEVNANDFDDQIDIFFHLLDDEAFGSQRALKWTRGEQDRRRFLRAWSQTCVSSTL